MTVNGTPVDLLDDAGNFWTDVVVRPSENTFRFVATDANDQTAETTITPTDDTAPAGTIDYSQFVDLTATFRAEYSRTSFRAADTTLYTDIAVRSLGQYPASVPLYVGVKNVSDPAVRVLNAAGTLPDGTLSLAFSNPNRGRFTYDLVFLGVPNRAPSFASIPELEATPGCGYTYDANPDADPLSFALVGGPVGMTVNAATGVLSWTPTAAQLGHGDVTLSVTDGHGGTATQAYAIGVTATGNRSPVIVGRVVLGHDARRRAFALLVFDADGHPPTRTRIAGRRTAAPSRPPWPGAAGRGRPHTAPDARPRTGRPGRVHPHRGRRSGGRVDQSPVGTGAGWGGAGRSNVEDPGASPPPGRTAPSSPPPRSAFGFHHSAFMRTLLNPAGKFPGGRLPVGELDHLRPPALPFVLNEDGSAEPDRLLVQEVEFGVWTGGLAKAVSPSVAERHEREDATVGSRVRRGSEVANRASQVPGSCPRPALSLKLMPGAVENLLPPVTGKDRV